MTDHTIPRDRWDRPMLFPPEGGKRVGYSRPSTLGKDLDKKDHLIPYEQAIVAMGFARNKHLFSRLRALLAKGAEWSTHRDDFKALLDPAKVAGGGDDKADRGTAIHDLCEAVETGWMDWDLIDEDLVPMMRAFEADINPHLNVIARECFVTVDRKLTLPDGEEVTLRAAGSIDRIVRCSDGKLRILDIKSGRDDEFRMGVTGQTTLYAWGELYRDDIKHQEYDWAQWHPNVDDTAERACLGVEQDYAIMLQAPRFPKRGRWTWNVWRVPLSPDLILCGQWARKLRQVPKFERVDL